MAEVEQLISGKLENVSQNLKCFKRCLMEKSGFFKDGTFNDEKFKEHYKNSPNKDAMLASYEECKKIKGANDCDTIFKVGQCMRKASSAKS